MDAAGGRRAGPRMPGHYGSLPGEPASRTFDADADFDAFVRHLDDVLDAAGVARAVICGVSFGGLIALRYAASAADRVRGADSRVDSRPALALRPQLRRDTRSGRRSRSPLFVARARPPRILAESCARCIPIRRARLSACVRAGWRGRAGAGRSARMGRRAQLAERQNFEADCARVKVPTLVVTGERDLDLVVPCDDTHELSRSDSRLELPAVRAHRPPGDGLGARSVCRDRLAILPGL